MAAWDDDALDAALRQEVGNVGVIYALSTDVEANLLTHISATPWYRLNIDVRPDACANAKLRILEEARIAAHLPFSKIMNENFVGYGFIQKSTCIFV
jgi:hypothetical protein